MANTGYRTFGLAALLGLTAIIAATIAGYQNGFAVGESDGLDSKTLTKSYSVGPLVIARDGEENATPDYQPLIDLITSTISSDTWGNVDTSIQAIAQNHSLVIVQTASIHDQIQDMLNKLNGLNELYDERFKNGLCLQCGHDKFLKPKTVGLTKAYNPECGRCGHPAPWTTLEIQDD